jgi:hypothetical protein
MDHGLIVVLPPRCGQFLVIVDAVVPDLATLDLAATV